VEGRKLRAGGGAGLTETAGGLPRDDRNVQHVKGGSGGGERGIERHIVIGRSDPRCSESAACTRSAKNQTLSKSGDRCTS